VLEPIGSYSSRGEGRLVLFWGVRRLCWDISKGSGKNEFW